MKCGETINYTKQPARRRCVVLTRLTRLWNNNKALCSMEMGLHRTSISSCKWLWKGNMENCMYVSLRRRERRDMGVCGEFFKERDEKYHHHTHCPERETDSQWNENEMVRLFSRVLLRTFITLCRLLCLCTRPWLLKAAAAWLQGSSFCCGFLRDSFLMKFSSLHPEPDEIYLEMKWNFLLSRKISMSWKESL
jgi:hypothetical protein